MRARMLFAAPLLAAVALGAIIAAGPASAQGAAPKPRDIVVNYANIAEAMYGDALSTAKALQTAVNAFIAEPTEANLDKAKTAWKAARVPYQQTEGFRFGNALVFPGSPEYCRTRHSPSASRRESIPTTTHCTPNAEASSPTRSGRSSAGEFTEILSAPDHSTARASATDRMPPATQNGMSIRRATRSTHA